MAPMTTSPADQPSGGRCLHGVKVGKCRSCDRATGYSYVTATSESYHTTPECPALRIGHDPMCAPDPVEAILAAARSHRGYRRCRACCLDRAQVTVPLFSLDGDLDPIGADRFMRWIQCDPLTVPSAPI